ncbi:MAG TPA: hypothetical protein ENF62_02895 [Candidatus Bathyarchaeota archaeon]|nr:hypothetical protein [Candidatus Bathyarchaeota archaeon]
MAERKNSENGTLEDREGLRLMADMLRSGATLTKYQCPACNSPLFRLKNGQLWCAKCQKPVVLVREGEEVTRAIGRYLLSSLEDTLLLKIEQLNELLRVEAEPQEIGRLSIIISRLLDALERVRRASRR